MRDTKTKIKKEATIGSSSDVDPVSIVLAAVIGVVAFATSFGHVEHVAADHGWHGITALAPPTVTELLASASAANGRWRMRVGANLVLPAFGVALGLAISVTANLATADDGFGPMFARLPWGTILGALMPLAFLLSLLMIEPMITGRSKPTTTGEPARTSKQDDHTESVTTTITETEEIRTEFAAFRTGELPHGTDRTGVPHGADRTSLPHGTDRTGVPHGTGRTPLEIPRTDRTEVNPHDPYAVALALLGGSVDSAVPVDESVLMEEGVVIGELVDDNIIAISDGGEAAGHGMWAGLGEPVPNEPSGAQDGVSAPIPGAGLVLFTAPPADLRPVETAEHYEPFGSAPYGPGADLPYGDPHAPHAEGAYGATHTRTVRTEEIRTKTRVPSPRTDDNAERAEFVRTLAARIRTNANWRPDYDALMRESGFKKRWCEKAVSDARALAASPRTLVSSSKEVSR